MLLSDYIIDHQKFDWPTILADWSWLLPEELTVWIMNRYGDLILVFNDGTVHMLDVGAGSVTKLAEDRDEFCRRIDEDNNASDWLMVSLVDQMTETGKLLQPDQCYSFVILPILGGEYSITNTVILSVVEHYGFHASIHQQIKDFPEGRQVIFVKKA